AFPVRVVRERLVAHSATSPQPRSPTPLHRPSPLRLLSPLPLPRYPTPAKLPAPPSPSQLRSRRGHQCSSSAPAIPTPRVVAQTATPYDSPMVRNRETASSSGCNSPMATA